MTSHVYIKGKFNIDKFKALFLAAFELVKNPNTWCQGMPARDIRGNRIHYTHSDAVSFCSIGAIGKANLDINAPKDELNLMLNRYCYWKYGIDLAAYNDSCAHANVIALWEDFGKCHGYIQ